MLALGDPYLLSWVVFSVVWSPLLNLLTLDLLSSHCMLSASGQVIGIDLGSEFVKAAVVAPGQRMEILLSDSSQRKVSNAISYVQKEERRIGDSAAAITKKPESVFLHSNILLGLKPSDVGVLARQQSKGGDEEVDDASGEERPDEGDVIPPISVYATFESVKDVALNRNEETDVRGSSSSSPLTREYQLLRTMKDNLWPSGFSSSYYPYRIYMDVARQALVVEPRSGLLLPVEHVVGSVLSSIRQSALRTIRSSTPLLTTVMSAVMSVPCSYTQKQRVALRDALSIGGLKALQFVHHGAAAAVQHALDITARKKHTTKLLLDIGSTQVDATVVRFLTAGNPSSKVSSSSTVAPVDSPKEGVSSTSTASPPGGTPAFPIASVKVLGCSTNLMGGHHVDLLLAEELRRQFEAETAENLLQHPKSLLKLLKTSQSVKKMLSANKLATFHIENVYNGMDISKHVDRNMLESILMNHSNQQDVLNVTANKALAAANVDLKDIDELELVGGGWRVPLVYNMIQQYASSTSKNIPIGTHINGDEAMATGAAFVAANSTTAFRVKPLNLEDGFPYEYKIRIYSSKSTDIKDGDEKKEDASSSKDKFVTLLPKYTAMSSQKVVSYRSVEDFSIDFHEEDSLLYSFDILDVSEALIKAKKEIGEAESSNDSSPEGEKAELDVTNPLPKASIVFKVDGAGVFYIEKAFLVFERTFLKPVEKSNSRKTKTTMTTSSSGGDDLAKSSTSSETPEMPPSESSSVSSSTNAPPPAAKVEYKKVTQTFSYPLTVSIRYEEYPLSLSASEIEMQRELLLSMETAEMELKQLMEATNTLEALVYAARGYLTATSLSEEDGGYLLKVSTLDQRQKLLEQLQIYEDWIYDDKFKEEGISSVQTRIQYVKDNYNPIVMRVEQVKIRPAIIKGMDNSLTDSFKELEDLKAKKPWMNANIVSTVQDKLKTIQTWWTDKQNLQDKRTLLEDPVYMEEDVQQQQHQLKVALHTLKKLQPPTTTTTTTTTVSTTKETPTQSDTPQQSVPTTDDEPADVKTMKEEL